MGLARNIMGGGFSAGQAKALNGAIRTGISAAGTVITDAFDLTGDINLIAVCASGAGVQLPSGEVGDSLVVYNGGANACKVYPDVSTALINQIPAGTAMTLGTNTSCIFYKVSTTQWFANLSA